MKARKEENDLKCKRREENAGKYERKACEIYVYPALYKDGQIYLLIMLYLEAVV